MKYLKFVLVLCVFYGVIATEQLVAETDSAQKYSLHLAPGSGKVYSAAADNVANALPARLATARLSVVTRPESPISERLKAATESALQTRFRHISLLDRKNLDAILAEQGRSMEDYVNVRTAPELQRVELAQAILFIDIQKVGFLPELTSLVVTASIVDVETAVKVWQSPPLTYTSIWMGYPIGLIIIIIILILPFYLAYRRASRKAREIVLQDFNYTQLHPRLLATKERLSAVQRDLYKRQYKNEAREIFSVGEQIDHLIDRAKILDTAVAEKGSTNSKKLLDNLEKTADRIDGIERVFADMAKSVRDNNLKSFDEKLTLLWNQADEILSEFTHLEQMK